MIAKQLTLDVVFELAPDARSAQAALRLVDQHKLDQLRISPDGSLLAGLCRGTDPRDQYTVAVDLGAADPASASYVTCTCPSMKLPCKHALALMAAYIQQPGEFRVGDVPQPRPDEGRRVEVARRQPAAPSTLPQPTLDQTSSSFLQTILESPDDDSPRLVYADWLEEHGDLPRAELIRVQCELGRRGRNDPGRLVLADRAEQLLLRHRKQWLAPLPIWLRRMRPVFHRGFVEEVTVTAHLLLKYLAALFAAAPVRTVRLELVAGQGRSVAAHAAALAGAPLLARLSCLDLSPNARAVAGHLRGLLHTPFLGNLRSLLLNGLPVAHHHLDAVTTPYLEGLRELELRDAALGPAAVRALASWSGLRQLSWLDLCGNQFGAEGARALAASAHMGEDLQLLVSAEVGATGLAVLRDRLGDRLQVAGASGLRSQQKR